MTNSYNYSKILQTSHRITELCSARTYIEWKSLIHRFSLAGEVCKFFVKFSSGSCAEQELPHFERLKSLRPTCYLYSHQATSKNCDFHHLRIKKPKTSAENGSHRDLLCGLDPQDRAEREGCFIMCSG